MPGSACPPCVFTRPRVLSDLTGRRAISDDFPRAELRRVAFVRAGRAVGLPLADIAAALAELPTGRTPNRRDWQMLSARWRRRLNRQIEDLVALRDRLDGCIGCGCLSLRRCALYNRRDEVAGYGAGARLFSNSDPADVRE